MLFRSVFGVFAARDLFFLFFFYELAVLPMYLLIGVWGSSTDFGTFLRTKEYGAMKLMLFLIAGSILVWIAILAGYVEDSDAGAAAFSKSDDGRGGTGWSAGVAAWWGAGWHGGGWRAGRAGGRRRTSGGPGPPVRAAWTRWRPADRVGCWCVPAQGSDTGGGPGRGAGWLGGCGSGDCRSGDQSVSCTSGSTSMMSGSVEWSTKIPDAGLELLRASLASTTAAAV